MIIMFGFRRYSGVFTTQLHHAPIVMEWPKTDVFIRVGVLNTGYARESHDTTLASVTHIRSSRMRVFFIIGKEFKLLCTTVREKYGRIEVRI